MWWSELRFKCSPWFSGLVQVKLGVIRAKPDLCEWMCVCVCIYCALHSRKTVNRGCAMWFGQVGGLLFYVCFVCKVYGFDEGRVCLWITSGAAVSGSVLITIRLGGIVSQRLSGIGELIVLVCDLCALNVECGIYSELDGNRMLKDELNLFFKTVLKTRCL